MAASELPRPGAPTSSSRRSPKIRHKLLASYSALWLVVALVGNAAVYVIVRNSLRNDIERHMETTTDTIVELVHSSAQAAVRNRLRGIARSSLEIAAYFHHQNELGLMSQQEAQRRAGDLLLQIDIGASGYIYCLDSSGVLQVHPKPELRGADISSYGFVQDQIARRSGYLEYKWQNPDDAADRPKALYMEYFEPWDWIISASSYRTEFTSLLEVDDFRDRILSIRFGETGYPYVLTSNGDVVIHPSMSGNVYDITDSTGRHFIREICDARTGTTTYTWKNPEEDDFREKLAVFRYLPDFDWIVVASSYTDEFFAPLEKIRRIFFATALLTLVLLVPLTIALSSTITKPIERLVDQLRRGTDGDLSVRAAVDSGDEIGRLAHYFNHFMSHLEESEATREQMENEQEQITIRLRQSEKMQAVGQLAGGMAHDFNNILSAVVGHADLMLGSDLSPEDRTRAERIVTAAERARSLTRTLLDFSRQGAVSPVDVDISDVVHEVIKLLTHSIDKRILINTELDNEQLVVRGDPGRLENMLLNLGLNARDAMPEGGRLTFATQRCSNDEIAAAGLGSSPHGWVKITVSDSGSGLDPDILPRVFDPFFTTKEAGRGTGLGLTSAYGCVQSHGGTIDIRNAEDGGAQVEIVLPLVRQGTAPTRDSTKRPSAPGKLRGLAMVVDDEEFIREFAEESLQDMGLSTIGCSDGIEAVEVFGRRHGELRLVLLDVVMPRLDGFQTLDRFTEIDPTVPVVLCSGYPGESGAMRDLPQEAAAFLGKPYRVAELREIVERVLGSRTA